MLTQSPIIQLPIDLKKQKTLLDYKTPWSFCWKMLYKQKQHRILFSMPHNALQHVDTHQYRTTYIKTRYQSIVSLFSLNWFFLKLFNNSLPW